MRGNYRDDIDIAKDKSGFSFLRQQAETMGIMSVIQNIMPIAFAIFVSMTSATAASLSLEGKNRWKVFVMQAICLTGTKNLCFSKKNGKAAGGKIKSLSAAFLFI